MSLQTGEMNNTPTPSDLAVSISEILASQIHGNIFIAHVQLSGVFDQLGPNEKNWLLYGFALLINAPSEFTAVNDVDRVVFHPFGQGPKIGQPIYYMSEDGTPEPNGETAVKIPRPPNAFILYRKDHHHHVKKENPGIHNNEISVIIGQQWNGESTEVRNHYLALSEQAKLDHLVQYPNYHYRPRRPEQKKRRMTKEKKRKMMARLLEEETNGNQGINLANDTSDMQFLVPKPNTPVLVVGPNTNMGKIELAKSVIYSTARDIDYVSWNSINAEVDLMDKGPNPIEGDRVRTIGVAPGAYLWSK